MLNKHILSSLALSLLRAVIIGCVTQSLVEIIDPVHQALPCIWDWAIPALLAMLIVTAYTTAEVYNKLIKIVEMKNAAGQAVSMSIFSRSISMCRMTELEGVCVLPVAMLIMAVKDSAWASSQPVSLGGVNVQAAILQTAMLSCLAYGVTSTCDALRANALVTVLMFPDQVDAEGKT